MKALQPIDQGSYRELSVYVPDIEASGDAQGRVIVVIHGFMSAMPNRTFRRLYARFAASSTLIGVNLAPLDANASKAFLDEVAEHYLADRKVSVIGTSLGGFWAGVFGAQIGAQSTVMINPVTEPVRQLAQYAGQHLRNELRQVTYHVTREALDTYSEFKLNTDGRPPSLIILGGKDEVLDHTVTIDKFAGTPGVRIVSYPDDAHAIDLKGHPALEQIAQFCGTGV